MKPQAIENSPAENANPRLTVYFDGACPLCRREIGLYRKRRGADAVDWVDVACLDAETVAPDLSRSEALARFHVRRPDGTLVSGARGFGALWAVLPGFRWLATLLRPAFAGALLEIGYRAFLVVRPSLQRLAARADARSASDYPGWLERELRSDHAGETGAVAIYLGILRTSRSRQVRRFATRHLRTERRHLVILRQMLPKQARSKLLGLWHVAGWLTGALPALCGPHAVYATIEVVESFVDRHYRQQLDKLADDQARMPLRMALESCHRDELAHRDEARRLATGTTQRLPLRLWLGAVAFGSKAGVALARRF